MLLRLNGQEKTTKEWALEIGLAESTIRRRLQKGWSAKKVLTTLAQSKNQHTGNGNGRKIKLVGWVENEFDVLRIDKPKVKVRGLAKGIWGIYKKLYNRTSLIHIPTGKRVSYHDSQFSIEKLQELADTINPMFPDGNLPREEKEIYKIIEIVRKFYSN